MSECSHPCGGGCCRTFALNIPHAEIPHRLTLPTLEADRRWMAHVTPAIDSALAQADGFADEAFTCGLLDQATGRCTIYEDRPLTCREYPRQNPDRRCELCGFSDIVFPMV